MQSSLVILDGSLHRKNLPCSTHKSQLISIDFGSGSKRRTLKSWTPMTANMNSNRQVTSIMLPMVLTATMTHWTTCCADEISIVMPSKVTLLLLIYFKAFGSVDGAQRSEDAEDSEDFHDRNSPGTVETNNLEGGSSKRPDC